MAAPLFIAIMWLSTAPIYKPLEEAEAQPLTPYEQKFAAADGLEEPHDTVLAPLFDVPRARTGSGRHPLDSERRAAGNRR